MRNKIRTIALSAAIFAGLHSIGEPGGRVDPAAQQQVMAGAGDMGDTTAPYQEKFRPQFHFSPRAKWMNDPNGMVFYKGIYHLFFQYYPGDIVWGPMHWGHASSKDLVHWQEQPVALYPDSLGYIFSGSAVVDSGNSSGFGRPGHGPLVAIFTHHNPDGEKRGDSDFQYQSIAYSLDAGKTWVKYRHNPVLKNPGIKDFRDPHVMWYALGKKWVMALATRDRITFYSSPDLKDWKKESDFGSGSGAHGGVWECPDLFPLEFGGTTWWVLLVSVNPGGPNGGSGTQYFIGRFDGHRFHPEGNKTRWIDYGPDDYAGVTWNNTGNRRIFLGWMSNWEYANQVPTSTWRNAMTIPRELQLQRSGGEIWLSSRPVKELLGLRSGGAGIARRSGDSNAVTGSGDKNAVTRSGSPDTTTGRYIWTCQADPGSDFSVSFSNEEGERLVVGYEKASNRYYIDRSLSGRTDFNKEFAKTSFSPRISQEKKITMTVVVDESSVEVFADGGLTVMSCVVFPQKPLTRITTQPLGQSVIEPLSRVSLRSIW